MLDRSWISQLHKPRAKFEPGEILEQKGAVGGLVLRGEKAFVGAGEDGCQFLKMQQIGIERIYKGVDRLFQVGALNVVIARVEHGTLLGALEDGLDVAAGQWPGAEVLADVGQDFLAQLDLFNARDRIEKLQDIVRALRWEKRHTET